MALFYALLVTSELPITRANLLRSSTDPAQVQQAIDLDPILPDPYLLRAEILELHALDSREAWSQAARIAPRDPEPYIRRALASEQHGELELAERLLLQAESLHATWYPRWTLANFYARRGNSQAALHWARLCAQRASGDLRPLFVLIESLGVPQSAAPSYFPPQNREVLAAYLDYRARHPQTEGLEAAAERLLDAIPSHPRGWPGLDIDPWAMILRPGSARYYPLSESERSVLFLAWTRLVDNSLGRRAVQFQNQLAARFPNLVRGWTPDRPIPADGFEPLPAGNPFDWRRAQSEAIRIDSDATHQQLTVSLSGAQPERAELLSRLVFLEAKTRYRFQVETQCLHAANCLGLRWELRPTIPDSRFTAGAELVCEAAWKRGTFDIPALDEERLFVFSLLYQRPLGQARVPIDLQLRQIAAERMP